MSVFADEVDARVPYSWEDREPILELDFEIAEYHGRVERLQRRLAAEEVDAMVVYGGDAECSRPDAFGDFPAVTLGANRGGFMKISHFLSDATE